MAQPLLEEHTSEPFHFTKEKDSKLHAQINTDCEDMDRYAQPAREAGKVAIQGYMAVATGQYPDNRSRLFIPKIHAIIYARMSLEAANIPKVEYKARKESSQNKMRFINAAKENAEHGDGNLRADSQNLWFHQNFDKLLLGTGFRYLTYLYQERLVTVKDDNGNKVKKTMVVYDDIWDEVPDFFHVGVSRDMQPGMFGGRACYYDKFFHKDAFVEQFNTPYYTNVKKAANMSDWYGGQSTLSWDVPQNYVRVRYYWDLFKDLFYVQANGIPIRQDMILDYGNADRPKKFLPITSLHNDIAYDTVEPAFANILQGGRQYVDVSRSSTNKTFWTKGDAKLVQGLIGFSNSIWRAAHDHTKASSVHFLLAQSAGVYDQIRTSDLYGIIPVKGTGSDTFDVKSLTQGSQYLEKFQGMDKAIDDLMTHALGNDWRRISSELTDEKATVAAIRQQVQKVRMSQNAKFNETGGIKRHYHILLNLIQQYYPEQVMRTFGEVDVDEKDILRDRDGHPVKIRAPKDIILNEEVVVEKSGDSFAVYGADHPKAKGKKASKAVPARKEYIVTEEEPEVYVVPGSSFAEMKAIDRALYIEWMNSLSPFFSLSYEDGPLIDRAGAEYIVTRGAELWEMETDKLFSREKRENKEIPEPFEFGEQPPAMPSPVQTAAQPPSKTGLAQQVTL